MASRRSLFAAAAVLPLAGAAAVAQQPNPDAEIVDLCSRFLTARDAYNSDGGGPDDDPLWDVLQDLDDAVMDAEPQTPAGLAAKARAADESGDEEMAWDVIDDVLRLFGGPV